MNQRLYEIHDFMDEFDLIVIGSGAGTHLKPLIESQVIHPAISEVLVKAFLNLERPDRLRNENQFKND